MIGKNPTIAKAQKHPWRHIPAIGRIYPKSTCFIKENHGLLGGEFLFFELPDKRTTDDQIKKLASGNNNSEESTLEPIKNIFLTANRAKKEFLKLKDCQKRHVLETLLWNLRIENQKVASYKLKMPYHILAKAPQNRDFAQLLRAVKELRTVILNGWKSYELDAAVDMLEGKLPL